MLLRLLPFGSLALAAGCGSGAPPGHFSDWDQCTVLDPSGSSVKQSAGTGTPPVPAGGTIVAGRYVLTDQTVFGATSLTNDEPGEVYQFDADTFAAMYLDQKSDAGKWSTSGTTLQLSIGCVCQRNLGTCSHASSPAHVEYTATPSQLVYFEDYINGGLMVQTFTRR